MATVTLENVTKIFKAKKGEVRAIDDLSFTVADREFVVLVGPSGCGKTTTLRVVAGLEQVDRGTIRIGDRVVNDVAPKDRDIAMVFQNYALYPHMTVFKNMALGLQMRRVPKDDIQQRVHQVADMLGIGKLLDRKPAALSGGECQRVAVGRAIVRRPQVFLFDEPLSNLDARLRVRMRTEIKSLHRKLQATILYVTHDQEEAMTLGDRLVIMNDGVVQQCGAPLDLYNLPVNRFVAGFMGTPPMNFLDGRLQADGETVSFTSGAYRLRLTPHAARRVKPHLGLPVTLGVRPEHLRLASKAANAGDTKPPANDTASINASVSVVEPLGDCVNVHLALPAGETMVARVSPDASPTPPESVRLVVDMSRAHLFAEGAFGERFS